MTEPAKKHSPSQSEGPELYDAAYFAHHCAEPYERTEHWSRFFGHVAERIIEDINPRTVLDAGCAMGFFVEALCDRGVDARGFDVSEFAISQTREDLRGRFWVGSILEPLPQRYELITCIEVLEHLEVADAVAAIENLCHFSDDILISSTPIDLTEETHINVHTPDYWAGIFARQGFFRDPGYDASYLTYWAIRFRKRSEPVHRLVAEYETALWALGHEKGERDRVVINQMEQIKTLRKELDSRRDENAALRTENERQAHELGVADARVVDAQHRLFSLVGNLARAEDELDTLHEELGHARHLLRSPVNKLVRLAAPTGTKRRATLRKARTGLHLLANGGPGAVLQRLGGAPVDLPSSGYGTQYHRWLELHEPKSGELSSMRATVAAWTDRSTVSILMPVYNPDPQGLEHAISSVLEQVYPDWELCIADDCSTDMRVRELLQKFSAFDPRIKVTFREQNGGIGVASASCLDTARGELCVLLDHDDVLRPHALYEVVSAFRNASDTDMVYTDEDKILLDGQYGQPAFKPDWSPDFLLSTNYICHLAAMRTEVVRQAGGFRSGFDGSQDHDLFLRVSEKSRQIKHIPKVLYGWKQVLGSAAIAIEAKPASHDAGKRAIEDALSRRGRAGRVEGCVHPGLHTVRYDIIGKPTVEIIVGTRDRPELLRRCIQSIEDHTNYSNFSITLVDNGSTDHESVEFLNHTKHKVVRVPGKFVYGAMLNQAGLHSSSDYLLFMHNDTEAISAEWIEAMLEHAQHSEVGVVGCALDHPNGTPQHRGLRIDSADIASSIGSRWPVIRNVSAVSSACMMVRRAVFTSLGGFDEEYVSTLGAVDLCLRALEAGYLNVYTPIARLSHRGNSSGGSHRPTIEDDRFRNRWLAYDSDRYDRFESPHIVSWEPLKFRV